MDRDSKGHFMRGNGLASIGGQVRAQRLSPARRAEIASMGFRALAGHYFAGNEAAAKQWLSQRGVWAGLFSSEAAAREFPLPDPRGQRGMSDQVGHSEAAQTAER